MLSETLTQGLDRYAIGAKIRALRQGKEMGLVALGAHTGLSPGLLSKLERGRLYPTLPTLLRIALVFDVGLDHFFVEPAPRPVSVVVRQRERVRLPSRPGDRSPAWLFESLTFGASRRLFDAYWAEFAEVPERRLTTHAHAGAELVFVMQGRLDLRVGDERHVLAKGDVIYFDSRVPHAYRRAGAGPCTAIVVTAAEEDGAIRSAGELATEKRPRARKG
jgi:transcriptional regulator with XRE-family HTH domain